MNAEAIISPISKEYEEFKRRYSQFAETDNPLLKEVFSHIVHANGKHMRPVLTLLFAKLHGEIGENAYNSAIAMELVHTASLVHDDVVDSSLERRNQPSVNAVFGNKVAVLSGDYLSGISMQYIAKTENAEMAKLVAGLALTLTDGELYQLFNSHENIVSEDVYFSIIRKKTAALFSVCAQLGAMCSEASEEDVANAAKVGEYIGLCFQIRDDIFDYYDSKEIGKPTGSDIREGKLTLPIIWAVNNYGDKKIFSQIEKLKNGTLSDSEIDELITFAREKGGIAYAEKVMYDYRDRALALLPANADPEVLKAIKAHSDLAINRKS